MTLTSRPGDPSDPAEPSATDDAATPASLSRDQLLTAVIDEMSHFSRRGRLGAMRRWHQGALSLIHLNVLNALEVDGPLSMSAVADALDVSIASATGIVDRMEKRGLVERRHSTDDRRVVEVHLAAQGLETVREMESQMRGQMEKVIADLTDAELAAFLVAARAMGRAVRRRHAEHEAAAASGTGEAPTGVAEVPGSRLPRLRPEVSPG